jgi:hypothetical protein
MTKHLGFAAAVLLLIAGGWYLARSGPASSPVHEEASTSTLGGATTTKKDTGGSHPGLTYGEAVLIYTNRRIQFDDNCTATPNAIVLKNGTNVMFDNRAKSGRYITLDRQKTYFIRGYDFRILTLSSQKLPHTVVIDCGTGKNNAKIMLN